MRGIAVVAGLAHNQEVVGANPTYATNVRVAQLVRALD